MGKEWILEMLHSGNPLHVYSEKELDEIEEYDPALALRIARDQHLSASAKARLVDTTVDIDMRLLDQAIDEVKKILSTDGGDIELVEVADRVVRVRMKGACVGCPNAVLDLKQVVEKIVFDLVPGVKSVENIF